MMKLIFKILSTIVITTVALLVASQSITKIYRSPEAKPFVGDLLFNPYKEIDSTMWHSNFSKANFHAHTRVDVNGNYSVQEFYDAYKFSNYDIVGISDHNILTTELADNNWFIPTYEHGYNLNNFHKLMLSAVDVDLIDIPLMFLPRQQMQYAIERLSTQVKALSINHPERVRFVPQNVFGQLRGFSLMEINPDANTQYWDQILSAGNYTTLIASDDAHSITNRNSWFQRSFTMVCTPTRSPSQDDILKALKSGKTYAVVVSNERNAQGSHTNIPYITDISNRQDTINISLSEKATRITFIGNNGAEIAAFDNVSQAQLKISAGQPYIRMQAIMEDGITLLTNPLARTANAQQPAILPIPESVQWLTILNIIGWNLLALVILITLVPLIWRKRGKRTNFEDFMWGAGLKSYDPS